MKPLTLLHRVLLAAWDAVTDRRERLAYEDRKLMGKCECGEPTMRGRGECERCWLDRQY